MISKLSRNLALIALCAASLPRTTLAQPVGPALTNITRTATGVELSWPPQGSGTAYTIQARGALDDTPWLLAPSLEPWPIATNRWSDTQTGGGTNRFYRLLSVPVAERGKVLSTSYGGSLSTMLLAFLFNYASVPITPVYPVELTKVIYETTTPWGARTIASGALVLPSGSGPRPLVAYQHGTLTETNSAPSSMSLSSEVTVGLAFASVGYAAVLPDYLGMGDSPGLHPYHHARSEATAAVDFLRAARTICATNGYPLTDKLFLCGYSQGGHATMALLRELETYHTNEFTVTACAPMAGAYDLSGVTTADFLSNRPLPNPYYFAYLLAAYQDVYRLAPSFADLLAPPYNTTLPPLFDGNTSSAVINAAMPTDPTAILKPELLAAFRANPNHPLRVALRDNDLYRWAPRSPLRLYHCAGDQDVIIANSQVALTNFLNRGATQVQLIDPLPSTNHAGCVYPSLLGAKAWFDSLR